MHSYNLDRPLFKWLSWAGLFFILLITAKILLGDSQDPFMRQYTKRPHAYMKQAEVVRYTIRGQIKSKINAEHWAFVSEEGRSNISSPSIWYFLADGQSWHVTANKALAEHHNIEGPVDKVKLWESVEIVKPHPDLLQQVKVSTSALDYFPGTTKVSTEAPVAMDRGNMHIQGRGLKGTLDSNKVELLHDVQTHYDFN